jgi:hypothetical protein
MISTCSIEANDAKEMIRLWTLELVTSPTATTALSPPLATFIDQGPEMVNLTVAAFGQWVGEGNSLRGTNIAATLADYLTSAVALLEHWDMDDPLCLTRSGQPHIKPHPLLA